MKIGVYPEFCIIICELCKIQFIFEQMYLLCLITTPKKCIVPLKVNQLSTILSNPLSKKVKMAKICEKNVITLPKSSKKYSKNSKDLKPSACYVMC